jgi:hypothetical protein
MARLPQVGGDSGNWGTILNEFLSVEHEADGTLKADGTLADKADDSEVVKLSGNQTIGGTKTFSSSPVVPDPTTDGQAATKLYVDNVASSGAPDASTTTKGIVQLAGDLSGTATSPQIAAGVIVNADINASAAIAQSKVANLTSDLAAKQDSDADLTAISGLSPANDDLLQRKAGAWTNRTPAQVKTDLSLTKSDVGLSNVDNTSDATKNSASATLTNKTIDGSSNTLSNIPQSAVTSLTTDLSTLSSRITLTELQPEQANRSTEGQETFSRTYATSNAVTMTSQVLKLTYFTAYRTETINSLRTYTGAVAAGATPTTCKMGLYTVAGNGDLTRVGITANDTTLFSVVTTAYTKAMTASVSVTAGTRYAIAVLVDSTQTMPQLAGALPSIALVSTSPRIYGQITGQTDIPSSISAGSVTNSNTMHYGILIP